MKNLTPTKLVRHIIELDIAWLRERNVRSVLCDVDNTLVPWHSEEILPEVMLWVQRVRAAGMQICLVSNTRNPERLERLADRMGILFVPGNSGKPGKYGYLKALELTNSKPEEAVMIGDQLFTDVFGANRLGIASVLVNPMSSKEFIGTKLISRTLEKLILRGERARPV
jgi:uncharacterized protein